ncbi:hypothetical protein EJD97_019202 [Solanum chilense]|uniref:Retrotransposon gag domain-containing protein n=1 Tax=Solanum chilense TaxID=4083 RepID=A0A6N2CBI0_SOLCI|nr:hypothetical protein EJD97_019202 [Solanum chilense]
MNTRRITTRRFEEGGVQEEAPQGGLAPQGVQVPQDAQVPPRGDQVPIEGEGDEVPVVPSNMTNGEIREALPALDRAMTTHVIRYAGYRVNALESTMTSRYREFVRMNPPIFLGSKVGEDPQFFFDGVYKVLSAIGVTSREKAELASYQLRDVAQVQYTQWKDNRSVDSVPIEWKEFKEAFLEKYFPHDRREKHSEKCLVGTENCFGYGKDGHKVRDFPNGAARGKEFKQDPPSVLEGGASKTNLFYALQARGSKPDENDDIGYRDVLMYNDWILKYDAS